jgi:hypothetical protein
MSFDPLLEGDPLDDVGIDAIAFAAANDFNTLQQGALRRKCLDHQHLPDEVDTGGLISVYGAGSEIDATSEDYSNCIGVTWVGGIQHYLTNFMPGAYGPAPVADPAVEGWAIPEAPTGGHKMELGLTGPAGLTISGMGLVGMKVNAWVALAESSQEHAPWPHNGSYEVSFGPTHTRNEFSIYLGVGVEDDTGTRMVINRSIRRVAVRAGVFSGLNTSVVIKDTDLVAPLDGTINKVFAAVINGVPISTTTHPCQHTGQHIQNYELTWEPIRAGVLE